MANRQATGKLGDNLFSHNTVSRLHRSIRFAHFKRRAGIGRRRDTRTEKIVKHLSIILIALTTATQVEAQELEITSILSDFGLQCKTVLTRDVNLLRERASMVNSTTKILFSRKGLPIMLYPKQKGRICSDRRCTARIYRPLGATGATLPGQIVKGSRISNPAAKNEREWAEPRACGGRRRCLGVVGRHPPYVF